MSRGMKIFVESEIIKQIEMVKNFKSNLLLSALKDDGIVDKEEQKIIDKANKLSEKYVKDLKKIMER